MDNLQRLMQRLGKPIPDNVKLMQRVQEEIADVKHVCPECGGQFADHLGAGIAVEMCWACHGAGTLTVDELRQYETMSNALDRSFITP